MLENLHNLDIENEILGAMLLKEGKKIPVVLGMNLTADDFTRAEYKILFRHIVNLYSQGTTPNTLLLVESLKKTGEFEAVGTDNIINLGRVYTDAYTEKYAKIIKEKSDMRRLMLLSQKMTAAIEEGKKSVTEIISDISNEFSGFNAADGATKFTKSKDFFVNDYKSEIERAKKYSLRKTGFFNLDELQIFSPGLYVIGGVPAAGKTSFAWQTAEQLAQHGEICIFCSYEMSKLELFTKSIARELFKRKPDTKLTAAEIRRGGFDKEIDKIIAEKQNDDSDLRVLELHDETVDDLLRILRPICSGDKAVSIFIDYLQIIPTTKDNTKNGIDDVVRKLKVFQRDHANVTFVLVSSVNRNNYNQPVAFESFKESGNIEFGSDCVWGLQLNIVNDIGKGAEVPEVRKKIDDAKKEQPRQIQLKCLKNRQGKNYECYFKYYSAHDYFEPCKESDFKASTNKNLNWNK